MRPQQPAVPFKVLTGIEAKKAKLGWTDYKGNNLEWHQHQGPNHDAKFAEPKEPRAKGKKKFVKKERE